MESSLAKGSSVPRISFAPVVFGLRSAATSRASGFGETGDERELAGADFRGEGAGEEEFLVGHAAGGDDGDLFRGDGLEFRGGGFQRVGPGDRAVLGAVLDERLGEAGLAVDVVEIQAVRIRHPARVHLVVLARGDAVDLVAAGPDGDVGAGAAVHVDGRGFLEEPDAHLEAEVVGGQRADRADVGGVERVVGIQQAVRMDGERGVGAALGEAEHRIAGDFVHEADAAAAHDAALVVEPDARADIDVFRLFHLHVHEARNAAAVLDGLFLEAAFAGLVADRAIERVVDEEEFHHALAAFFDEFAGGADAHVFGNRVGAGDDRARHPADGFVAVFVPLRLLAGRGAGRHAHLHEAHPAVSGRTELRMVTIVGNDGSRLAAGLDHPCAFGKLVPDAVDLDVDHAFFGRKVFGQCQFRSRRRCVAHGFKEKPDAVLNIVRRGRAGLCRHVPYPASVLSEKFHKRPIPGQIPAVRSG